MFEEYRYHCGKLVRRKDGREIGWVSSNGYKTICYRGRKYLVHRVIWFIKHGDWPNNSIDHIDQDRLNNKISNLRDVAHHVNCRNQKRIKGCYWNGRKWIANISCADRTVYLGSFDSEDTARKEHRRAKKELDNGLTLTRPCVRTAR